jgi:hypothetical protein
MCMHRISQITNRRTNVLQHRRSSAYLRIAVDCLERRTLLAAGASSAAPMGIGMNLDYIDDFTTAPMFADIMKIAYDGWWVTPADSVGDPWSVSGVTEPPMDQNG